MTRTPPGGRSEVLREPNPAEYERREGAASFLTPHGRPVPPAQPYLFLPTVWDDDGVRPATDQHVKAWLDLNFATLTPRTVPPGTGHDSTETPTPGLQYWINIGVRNYGPMPAYAGFIQVYVLPRAEANAAAAGAEPVPKPLVQRMLTIPALPAPKTEHDARNHVSHTEIPVQITWPSTIAVGQKWTIFVHLQDLASDPIRAPFQHQVDRHVARLDRPA